MKHKIAVLLMIIIGISMITSGIITSSYNSKEKDNKKENHLNSVDNKDDKNDNEYIDEKITYKVHDITIENANHITTLTFIYDGKTLVSPFTLQDMKDIGITIDDKYMNQQIDSGAGLGNIDGSTRFTYDDNLLHLSVINDTNYTLDSKDCVVDYISTSNKEVTINGITPGVSKYKDILEIFGRDKKERMNLFENEKKRQKELDSINNVMSYSAQNKDFEWVYLDINLGINYDNNELVDDVRLVTYKR